MLDRSPLGVGPPDRRELMQQVKSGGRPPHHHLHRFCSVSSLFFRITASRAATGPRRALTRCSLIRPTDRKPELLPPSSCALSHAEGLACLGHDRTLATPLYALRMWMCAADPLERSHCAPATMPAAGAPAWWHNVLLRRLPSHWLL